MVPRLAAEGKSFKGAMIYYAHDKNAMTSVRVAWSETLNLLTQDIEKAWRVMAFTARHASDLKRASGRKRTSDRVEKPVVAYSLSWHPDQAPDRSTMLEAARTSLRSLGLDEHEAIIISHKDRPHPHLHVITSRTHPVTGLAASLYRSKKKLQDWARDYQKQEGTTYCPQREENHRKRMNGEHPVYADPVITRAWNTGQDAADFMAVLEAKGYRLARGHRRLVVVDSHGRTINPVRHLPAVQAKDFQARLAGVSSDLLPSVEQVLAARLTSCAAEPAAETVQCRSTLLPSPERKEMDQSATATDPHTPPASRDVTANKKHAQSTRNEIAAYQSHLRKVKATRRELERSYRVVERQKQIDLLQQQIATPSLLTRLKFLLLRSDRTIYRKIVDLEIFQTKSRQSIENALELENARYYNDMKILERPKCLEDPVIHRHSISKVTGSATLDEKIGFKGLDDHSNLYWGPAAWSSPDGPS